MSDCMIIHFMGQPYQDHYSGSRFWRDCLRRGLTVRDQNLQRYRTYYSPFCWRRCAMRSGEAFWSQQKCKMRQTSSSLHTMACLLGDQSSAFLYALQPILHSQFISSSVAFPIKNALISSKVGAGFPSPFFTPTFSPPSFSLSFSFFPASFLFFPFENDRNILLYPLKIV